jgi:hypothetical protein
MRSSHVVAVIAVLVGASCAHAQSSGDREKRLVYNDVTEGADAADRDAKRAYAGKFQFADIKQSEGFSPARLKGTLTSSFRFRDPRSMRDSAIRGKVVYVFIVTPEGRVLDPRVLRSTDERVSKYIIERISNERYFPARFRGSPVYTLCRDEWAFGGQDLMPRQDSDGLGINRTRDR